MPNDPHPDPAALAALLERMTSDEGDSNCPCPSCEEQRADAAALRAWAPVITAAVQWAESWLAYAAGISPDSAMPTTELASRYEAIRAARERYKAARAALAPGAGEGERG